MMKKSSLLILFIIVFAIAVNAQTLPAEKIMQAAYLKASAEHKKVFLIFHASWCGWCRKMDNSMNDSSCKFFFDDNFVITHLVVKESKGKEHLENPGAIELLREYKADTLGIPFWVILDADGKILADARMPPAMKNSGCPAEEKEVDYFIDVLKKIISPGNNELDAIKTRFRKNENKRPAWVPNS
jgi:thioredoxin-related protein